MATPEAEAAAPPTPNKPTGPVAVIKSHCTVLFRQKTRACRATATSPRGHLMVCDRQQPRTAMPHVLHAMVEQRDGGVRTIFWRVEGQKGAVAGKPVPKPRRTKKTVAAGGA